VFSPADPVTYLQGFEVASPGLDWHALAKKNPAWGRKSAQRLVGERSKGAA
jgi:hypothetical protein